MAATREQRRYSAFLSYSHHDAYFARRLQGWLESYRLPRPLRQASPIVNPQTGRLHPVFRDQSELRAAPDLSAALHAAIANASTLVVVCSPNAPLSTWVCQEIALARELLAGDALLAALFAGDPNAAFPPELVVQKDGARRHPLAADFRKGGDGRRLAVLKLVAAIAGVPLDALVRREAQRRGRRLIAIAALTTLLVAALAIAVALTLVARAETQREQERGVATVTALVGQHEQFGTAGRLDLLRTLDRSALAFFRDREVALLPADTQLLSARLLHGVSEDDEAAGDIEGLTEASAAAWRTTHRLLIAAPRNDARAMAHAQSEYWVGLAAWRRGDMTAARARFTAYAALAERYAAHAPARVYWQREAADANSNLGAFALRIGDLAEADRRFRTAQARALAAARLLPTDRTIQDRVADGYGWLADVERLNGHLATAQRYREMQHVLLSAMQARDPDDAGVQTSVINNQLGLARLAALQAHWSEADHLFEAGRAAALGRARRDPANADIARQARAFDLFQVRSWLFRPVGQRPSVERMQGILGNCVAEHRRSNNAEARTICTILNAELLALTGNVAGSRGLLASIHCTRGYSERWRLDFCDEAARAISATTGVRQRGEIR